MGDNLLDLTRIAQMPADANLVNLSLPAKVGMVGGGIGQVRMARGALDLPPRTKAPVFKMRP